MVHIAVDIGASSGRLVIGKLKQKKLELQKFIDLKMGSQQKMEHCIGTLTTYLMKSSTDYNLRNKRAIG